jgi:hypothetical protein
MEDDLAAKRIERLSPDGQELLAEIRESMAADDQGAIPTLVERIRGLPPNDQGEILELIALAQRGFVAEKARLDNESETAEAARLTLLAAQEKLRSEGRFVDPNMTVGEAREILER